MRLAKKILPGYRSYGLGILSSQLGISNNARHRALGDAEATAKIMKILIDRDHQHFINYSLKKTSREATLPSHLPKEVFDSLPEKAGVYYFHNEKGKVVYVGKAKNIKNRILGHFTGESSKSKRLFHENIHNISFELTGNELVAFLLESREIKRLWPEYNRAQKYASKIHGLYSYYDRNGYLRFTISKTQPGAKPIASFRNFQEGRTQINDLISKYKLCPKLCGLQKPTGTCFDYKIGSCDGACNGEITPNYYNKRVALALEYLAAEKKTFAIIGNGREIDEKSLVLVENGVYLGHGFTDYNISANNFEELKNRITNFPDNQDIQKILNSHLSHVKGEEVIYF